MRSLLRSSIPSMFHRRLLLLAAVAVAVSAVLVLQAARLSVGSAHAELLAEAESAMVRETLIPTVRGRILDRHGRVLAEDRPGWSVQLPYALFTGGWAAEAARAAAAEEAGRAWRAMPEAERAAAAATRLGGLRRQQAMFWETLPDVVGADPADVQRRRDAVVRRVGTVKAQYIGRRLAARRLETGDGAVGWDDIDDDTVAEELALHVIASGVGDAAASRLKVFAAEADAKLAAARLPGATPADRDAAAAAAVWREVGVERTRDRAYPRTVARVKVDRRRFPGGLASDEPAAVRLPGVALHVLGSMVPVYAGEGRLERRPLAVRERAEGPADLGGYRVGDPAGRFGVERVLESTLRGTRGKQVQRLEADVDGVRRVTRTEPEAGTDVTLTLDIELQAYLEALLSDDPAVGLATVQPWFTGPVEKGTALGGALVVVEIATGEVLGAATAPGVSRRVLEENRSSISGDLTFEPLTFRPTAYAREPGSTVKPIVLAAAITDGVFGQDEVMDVSSGHLYPNQPGYFQDWWRPMGGQVESLDGPTAIKISGNSFFGRLAQRLGPQRLHDWYVAAGATRKADLPLREAAGTLYDPTAGDAGAQADLTGIGQGKLTMTPVQLAAAHATLARGGRYLPPRLVRGSAPVPPGAAGPGPFTPEAVQAALLGMWKSANEGQAGDLAPGTTHRFSLLPAADGARRYHRIFQATGVDVFAKSGSAQTAPTVEKIDDDGDGLVDRLGEIVRAGAHAWAVALVGPADADPLYAIVAMVEHGYSGGTAAGPLCNGAIVALQKFGYLPPGEDGPGSVADGPQSVVFPDAAPDSADR